MYLLTIYGVVAGLCGWLEWACFNQFFLKAVCFLDYAIFITNYYISFWLGTPKISFLLFFNTFSSQT